MIKHIRLFTWLLLAACTQSAPIPVLDSPEALRAYFKSPGAKISAHRGGAAPGYPENCLETFQRTTSLLPAIIECDVSMTGDSVLVLLHDRTLDRTTTGSGAINEKLWSEISELRLKDSSGVVTPNRIPTLEAVLLWSKSRVPLTLDVRQEVVPEKVVQLLHRYDIRNAAIITHNAVGAKTYYDLDSTLMLSCRIRSMEDYRRLKDSGVPDANLLAFVGVTEPDRALYRALAEKNIPAILGVLGNLDRRAMVRGDHLYREWFRNGADILATDRPMEAYAAILVK